MNLKSPTRETMMRVVPPLTVWALGKIFELPGVKSGMEEMDVRASKQRYDMARSLKRGVKNARSNIPMLAAGAVAIVIGVGLIARAARGK